jgi:TRAP-type mannitol/chloroaromatic compound transport system permease large subunit
MNWIAVALSLFAMAINHLVFTANRDGVGLDTVWFGVLLAVFLVTVFLLVAKLLYHFRLPRDSTSWR